MMLYLAIGFLISIHLLFYALLFCLAIRPEKSIFMLNAIAEKAIGGFSDPSRKSLVIYYLEKF